MVPIVNSRFLMGHPDIPLEVVRNARSVFNTPIQALIPGKYDIGRNPGTAILSKY
jgi:hypothetical protein